MARVVAQAVAWSVGVAALACVLARPGDPVMAANSAPRERSPDFARDVRPVLANKCFKCHGPDEATREAKLRLDTREGATAVRRKGHPAITPGDPRASSLLARVTSGDPDEVMPPPEAKMPAVTPEEAQTIRRWIEAGAVWTEHWAFEPIAERAAPKVSDESWARGPIDRWVLATLDEEGLRPSARAERETLLRRVSLDVVGLPPTLEEQDAFLADREPGAYERAVDRLLASERYGEKWARWWLDLARYADSMGYEKDRGRTIWPYRDWVIRALNEDMAFDRFTELQLAGDLVKAGSGEESEANLLATAFHRNTMTNDEGGTDDEEFRVAAVIDRVNTTMEVWQGLTMGCAQCHTHKYDPLTHTDYYRVFAVFNNTQDADKGDDSPLLDFVTQATKARAAELDTELAQVEGRIAERVGIEAETRKNEVGGKDKDKAGDGTSQPSGPLPPGGGAAERRAADAAGLAISRGAVERVWIDDLLPAQAIAHFNDRPAAWPWVDAEEGPVPPARGTRCFGAAQSGQGQQYVTDAFPTLEVGAGDTLFVWVWIDPANPARTVMLQWYAGEAGWEHRAYWGDASIQYGGVEGSASRLRMGDVPELGRWVKLEIPAAKVGLEGQKITGWAFSQLGGRVMWDAAGVKTAHAFDESFLTSQDAWESLASANEGRGLPEGIRTALLKPGPERSDAEREMLAAHYFRRVHEPTRLGLIGLEARAEKLAREREQVLARAVRVPVLRELTKDRRVTHRFERGSFLTPAEEVAPGVPEVLEKKIAEVRKKGGESERGGAGIRPQDRWEFARWLTAAENPLTARVIANRVWEQLWGIGIVETLEDFGTQGAPPSHPELLDHLAVSLRSNGWSLKKLIREIVTSAAYMQSSSVSEELLARDPYNRLLARGARFRLDGETIRDQALAASGLLSAKMFGPPVYPPQPDGLWNMVIYSGDRWDTSVGDDRHRRGIYTFWRRTVPYPSMTAFDAPSREFCVSRRIRTNTPLQAYVTLNDPAFVECAGALAERVWGERREGKAERRKGGEAESEAARVDVLFRLVLGRRPSAAERVEMLRLVADQRARYAVEPQAAAKVVGRDEGTKRGGDGVGERVEGASEEELAERAAWVSACSVVLNLDEALTRE